MIFFCPSGRCQPRPYSLCPQPAASSQSLLWQSSGTFCGEAKTHRPNKWFWPIRESFECSVWFGWQTEGLKKVWKHRSSRTYSRWGGERPPTRPDYEISTRMCGWRAQSYFTLFLGDIGLSWRFLWWATCAFLISSDPSSLTRGGKQEDVSVWRPCRRIEWICNELRMVKKRSTYLEHAAVQRGWTRALIHSHQSVQL